MNRFWMYLKLHPTLFFLVILGGTILYTWLICMIFPIRYDDNDDITSAWILSGVYSGTPDCHVLFMNAIYGQLVAGLYCLFSNVEWYTILFIFILCMASAVLVFVNCRKINSTWLLTCFIFGIYTLLFYNLVCLQFTKVAAMTAFAGIVLLCDRNFFWGGVLLLIGSMIRFEAAGLVGLLMVPALFYSYRLDWRRGWLPLCIILGIVIGLRWADTKYYQQPEWATFYACNQYRGRINDNPNVWRVRQNLPPSVSQINYDCIIAFALDPEQATLERFKSLDDKFSHIPILKKMKNIYLFFLPTYWQWIIVLFLIGIVIAWGRSKKNVCLLLLYFIFWLSILAMVSLNSTVKFRVFVASLLPTLYYLSLCLKSEKMTNRKLIIAPILLLCMLLWGLIGPAVNQIQRAPEHDAIMQEQLQLFTQRNNRLVLTNGADLRVEYFDAFHLQDAIPSHSFINPYCFAGSPLSPEFMSYRDFIDGQLCLFSAKPWNVDLRLKSLKENYGIDAEGVALSESEHYALIILVPKVADKKL